MAIVYLVTNIITIAASDSLYAVLTLSTHADDTEPKQLMYKYIHLAFKIGFALTLSETYLSVFRSVH